MDLNCKLIEKTFTDNEGKERSYNALSFTLSDGSTLDVTIKADKAKLLKLSNNVNNMPDKNFWEK